jgi:hypothetical protein
MMSKSVQNSKPHCDKNTITRFRSLDIDHISAIESLFRKYSFLNDRVEIHMPFHKAKSTFTDGTLWVWPKFDKRPVGYLIFMDGFAPCIWYPDRQEGLTFRWLLPPNFCQRGPTICLANILAGESTLQVEDLIIYEGNDLWSNKIFSDRWNTLSDFWNRLPVDQPLLSFKTRVVKPISLSDWQQHYDPSIYWIIQSNHCKQPRWFWKDTVTQTDTRKFIPPTLKRSNEVITLLSAKCIPYTKTNLPDIYNLVSQEGTIIGVGSIPSIALSLELRKESSKYGMNGFPVEVKWNNEFSKYEIIKVLPENTPISTNTFFHHQYQISAL